MDFTIKVFDKEYKLSNNENLGRSEYYNNGLFYISCDNVHSENLEMFTFGIPKRFIFLFSQFLDKTFIFSYDNEMDEYFAGASLEDIPYLEKYLELYIYSVKKNVFEDLNFIQNRFGKELESFEAIKEII